MELDELITRIHRWKARMEGGMPLEPVPEPATPVEAAPSEEVPVAVDTAEEVSDGMLMPEEEIE